MASIIKAGWLNKQGGSFKSWKRRWFQLEDGEVIVLSYFPNEKAEGALGTLDMSQCRAVRPVPAKDTAKAFYFEVESPDRTYLINADSADSRDSWVQTIQDAIDKMSLKRQDGALTVTKTGYMWKQGGKEGNKGWRRRWFVLQNDSLTYYKTDIDKKILGRLNLSLLNSIVPADPLQVRRENCFKLYFAGRTYIIGAETPEEREEWMEILAASAPENAARATGAAAVHEEDDGADDDAGARGGDSGLIGGGNDELLAAQREAEQQPIDKQGWLSKTGGTIKTVKRRWFVLRGTLLSYFQTEQDKQPLGTIDLKKCTGLRTIEEERRGYRPYSFELVTPRRVYVIIAETPEDREEWQRAIADVIPEEPEIDDEEVKTLAERFLKRPFTGRLFGGDASSAPVESDPNAMKMIANAGDEDDDSPSSPTHVNRTRNDVGSLKSGWMMKQGGSVKTWKRRFFVLKGLALAYYETEYDTTPKGMIDLTQVTSIEKKPDPVVKGGLYGFDIVTRARTYPIEAETDTARMQWIGAISSIVDARTRPDQAARVIEKREGYLEKRGGTNRAWKRRYFVVLVTPLKAQLYYFPDEKRERPLGGIDLSECSGCYAVPLARHGRPNVFEVVTPDRIYAIAADSDEIRDGWMALISDNVPVGDLAQTESGNAPALKEGVIKVGVLEKKPTDPRATWMKRFIALTSDQHLYIYRSERDTNAIATIDLSICLSVREVPRSSIDRPFALSIQGKGERVYYLAAPSQQVLAEWVSAINSVLPADDIARANADAAESEPVLMCGYLHKMGGSRKNWRKRWFQFSGRYIRYYRGPKDEDELGHIDLNQVADSSCIKGDLKLEVPNGFAIITPDRTYYCGAETEDIRSSWLLAIRKYLDARGPVDPSASDSGVAQDDD